MLGDTDLSDLHEIEQLRRSVAMLPPNADSAIFTRSEALKILSALHQAQAALDANDSRPGSADS
jgi:hypothetical protein